MSADRHDPKDMSDLRTALSAPLFSAIDHGPHLRVATPFALPDGDLLVVFILRHSDPPLLGDLGETLRWLRSHQPDGAASTRRSERVLQLATEAGASLGVTLHHGELRTHARPDEPLGAAVVRLAQACLRVADLRRSMRPPPPPPFADEVEAHLRATLTARPLTIARADRIAGISATTWSVDFRVRTPHRHVLLFLLASERRDHARKLAEHVVAACTDLAHLRKLRRTPVQFITVFDDRGAAWNDADARLVAPFATPYRWSERATWVPALEAPEPDYDDDPIDDPGDSDEPDPSEPDHDVPEAHQEPPRPDDSDDDDEPDASDHSLPDDDEPDASDPSSPGDHSEPDDDSSLPDDEEPGPIDDLYSDSLLSFATDAAAITAPVSPDVPPIASDLAATDRVPSLSVASDEPAPPDHRSEEPFMPLHMRPATADDFPGFAELFRELGTGDPVPAAETWYAEQLPTTLCFEQAGKLVAYAFYEVMAEYGYVRNVVVAPAHRGRGLGGEVMRNLAALLRGIGCTRWCLNVEPANVVALKLYRSVGLDIAYRSAALRFPWELVDALPTSDLPFRTCPIHPSEDREIEQTFELPPGQLATLRAKRTRVLLRLDLPAPPDAAPPLALGFAAFNPQFPGAYPFRVARPELARPLLQGVRPHALPDTFMQVVIEDDDETHDMLISAGATRRLELFFLRGDLDAVPAPAPAAA